jgi:hypothetical protein
MSTLTTSIIPAPTASQTNTPASSPNLNPDGSPIVNVTVGNIITILGVLLFGVGTGLFIWWYFGREKRAAAKAAKNKAAGDKTKAVV